MNELILDFVGPYANWLMTLSLVLVILARRSMRKRHIVVLLTLTVVAFLAFFGVLVLGLARWRGSPELFQGVLFVLGAVTVGCGSAIGFWFILKSFGLTADEDEEEAAYPASRSRRSSK